jgi:chromate transporter
VILIVAAMLKRFQNSPLVQKTFYGLRPASTALIAAAGISVAVANLFDTAAHTVNWMGLILAAVLWLLTNKVKQTKKLHPIVFIGASALVGILFSMG